MWADSSVWYQIYPLGFCGAPKENDGKLEHRILAVKDWIGHIQRTGADCVFFNPLFESDRHGYDTRDYRKLDARLGANEDFAEVCRAIHAAGLKVVLDGVFNHVGRGFWAFQDVLRNRETSPYKDWFYVNFSGNNGYGDGLWYEGWEGHFELVKLNLQNPAVADYLLESVRLWTEWFDIDGLRLDVAYCLNEDFLRRLRAFTDALKPEFFLVGEMLHGDYNRLMDDSMLHSVTNYECYKGLYSAFNSENLFEIAHSLNRQFGPDPWCLYRGKRLLAFADNHDVTRVASILQNKDHLPLLYGILFGMPGIPCLYYGSEWGALGEKSQGDDALRPAFAAPQENELTAFIARLAQVHKENPALIYGSLRYNVLLTNRQMIFERKVDSQRILVAVNLDGSDYIAHFDAGCGTAKELIAGRDIDFGGGTLLPAYSVQYWLMER